MATATKTPKTAAAPAATVTAAASVATLTPSRAYLTATADEQTGEITETSRFRYLPGHPKQIRADLKAGVFNVNGEKVLGKTLSFIPMSLRVFADNILNMGKKVWAEVYFVDETGAVCAVLEPHRYQAPQDLPPAQLRLLDNLAAAVRRHRYCRDLLYRGTPELTHTATHTETGLTVKIRPDLLVVTPRLGRRVLVDFKTTSCRDYAQFVATIEQYDYDRQAAFYTDVLQADRFLIVGVQKKAPHDIWLVELSADAATMAQGRKKYARLLRAWATLHQPVLVT
ncbi:PD-(D/E)XK nuclease-like domain-containing protein [Hymenobacter psychrotolerans]|uniref:Putative exodeoxyribonuclease 8 PDDEXK-like domain-containing protein n=1 Tax=Hymenobacter psychrotolerans DSM 18569 TaxID=1121959 RepID=A0A1M7D7C6_9BACT|nr:PD-(D/E)XK nuclease-like domain-containing protein [Hymenobacter psychrotolerans]SHL75365.1 PDDEXK-like protein of unknown function [Hymenobacter psychrotolerans DSM 18569]